MIIDMDGSSISMGQLHQRVAYFRSYIFGYTIVVDVLYEHSKRMEGVLNCCKITPDRRIKFMCSKDHQLQAFVVFCHEGATYRIHHKAFLPIDPLHNKNQQ